MFKLTLRKSFWPQTRHYHASPPPNSKYFKISPEIREALHHRRPIVALESTIYTHGFPYPANVALASELESIVRVNGGVPATIGILDGVACVGLTAEEIIRLVSPSSSSSTAGTLKTSRRDLAYACGVKRDGKSFNGGTTVAATMILAAKAGIRVFATGGLGGVHRGGEDSLDVSADLNELGRTNVAVVASGCKSFLDVRRTLEYLETQGVGVATFADGRTGQTVEFPAFWARESGVRSPMVVGDEGEAAAMIHVQMQLGINSGLLFANPIPVSAAIPKSEMDVFIDEAIRQANEAGISGKENTPFILAKIKELTNGRSVIANRALIASNVKRGTLIAHELSKLESKEESSTAKIVVSKSYQTPKVQTGGLSTIPAVNTRQTTFGRPEIIVAGALAVDYSCDFKPLSRNEGDTSPVLHTSNPASITQSLGGVGHNIARAADYLGRKVSLYSLIGNDLPGKAALQQLNLGTIDTTSITSPPSELIQETAQYIAINDTKGDLVLGMADMAILEHLPPSTLQQWTERIQASSPKSFIADANFDSSSLLSLFIAAKSTNALTAFEPVSVAKSSRIFDNSTPSLTLPVYPNHTIDLTTPTFLELASMHVTAREAGLFERQDWWATVDALGIPSSGIQRQLIRLSSRKLVEEGIPQMCLQLLPFIPTVIAKLGKNGVLLTMLLSKDDARLRDMQNDHHILCRSQLEDPESQVGGVYMRYFPVPRVVPDSEVVSVNGVGDTFLGALMSRVVEKGCGIEEAVDFAQGAAGLTLRSKDAVSEELRSLRG